MILSFKQDRIPHIHREDNDPQFVVSQDPSSPTITFKWSYPEETEDFDERVSLLVEGKGTFNFCSDFLRWEGPSKYPQTVSSWTPHHLYFFRQGLWWFLDLCDSDGYDIAEEGTGNRININFDCQARHPFLNLQGAEWLFCGRGNRRSGEVRSYQICLYPLSTERPDVPIIKRFPGAYQAALCITDHADYDQIDPLKAVFWGDSRDSLSGQRGLSGRGLRITKSVFARSFPGYTGMGILDDDEFKRMIHRLHDEGHEIIPHGIRSFPGTQEELAKDFYEGFQTFKPKTWIDHIYSYLTLLPHSLAAEGLKPKSPYYIWPMLRDEGIDLLWAGLDIHNNPPQGKLSAFDLTDKYPLAYLGRSIKEMSHLNLRQSAYFFLEYISALYGVEKRIRLKQAFIKGGIIGFAKGLGILLNKSDPNRIIKKRQVQLFSDQNKFPGDSVVGTFCTIRLNELGHGISPERWLKVFRDHGVVLLHTYLACHHRLGDNAWERIGNRCQISPAFDQAMEFLADQVRQKNLWNPTVHEIWEWYKGWKKVRLIPDTDSGGWIVHNWPEKTSTGKAFQNIYHGNTRMNTDF